jgi:hypothetical protein
LNIDLVLATSSHDFHLHSNDIGDYIGKNIDNYTKCELLMNHWVPPTNYIFPYSEHNKNGKLIRRFLGQQHLNNFLWLVFSPSKQGLYCKYCPLFNVQKQGGFQ